MSKDKKKEIEKILKFIEDNNLFTKTPSKDKVCKNFLKDNGDIYFIVTSGEPTGEDVCSRCNKTLSAKEFSYYQARVGEDGYLNRSNALCSKCRRETSNTRKEVFKKDKSKIPPKPKKGDICDRCNRPWYKRWHKDHDDKTKTFSGWLCGNCNMAKGDQRNPHLDNK